MDAHWENYDAALNEIRADGATVDDVMRILKNRFEPSSSEAFFPGGADRSLLGVLRGERDDWQIVWIDADYYWCVSDKQGNTMSYIEGDVERGNCKAR
ncbi:hypothetical protein [Mycolicibacterium sp.]|uniref:hypothetical protein n=1 Tax=Mycolicibacterium sp. TaxID=2320850 RepID=UPI0037C94239